MSAFQVNFPQANSKELIANYVQNHVPEHAQMNMCDYIKEVTQTCDQQCIQAFEKIRNAVRERELAPNLSKRKLCIPSLIILKSSFLSEAVQVLFFEKFGLKIVIRRERTDLSETPKKEFNNSDGTSHSYQSEFVWCETDLEKIFHEKPLSPYEIFKARVHQQLATFIRHQERYPMYQRQKLTFVSEASVNPPSKLSKPPMGIEFFAKSAIFYSFNAEGVRDHDWGCAWRAIQTCLSSYNIKISFQDLFHIFGPLRNLQAIYQNKYPNEELNFTKPFAPYELSSGWAEPFIGEMAMHFYGIPARLETINGIPNCNAPHSVFHNPTLTFSRFKELLEIHFSRPNPAPIMIDDGAYAFNIIGIARNDSNITLWIADAHIKEGANLNRSETNLNGLYTVTLNGNGEQVSCSLNDVDQRQKSHLTDSQIYQTFKFDIKSWMILIPN